MKIFFSKPYFRIFKNKKKDRGFYSIITFNDDKFGRVNIMVSLYFWSFNFIISRNDYLIKVTEEIDNKIYLHYKKDVSKYGNIEYYISFFL